MKYNYSIIVPYRDKYDLFVKAVDSIPDRKDIQIVIVDNSVQSLKEEEVPLRKNSTVTYATSSSERGAGCARNVGLDKVEGRFILFLDADDYFSDHAFDIFDLYIEKEYDIVYFNSTSIRLNDGSPSDRHITYTRILANWKDTKDERRIRYCWNVPWAKLYRSEFVLKGGFKFEEIRVHNDAWFSTVTGHAAKEIYGDDTIVYVVTEGGSGQSLVKTVNKETAFTRYCARIRINKFLKSVGRYDMHIRLLGSLKLALTKFGLKEFWRYLMYAKENGVGVL